MLNERQILDALQSCCFDHLSESNCMQLVYDYADEEIFSQDVGTGATKIVLFPRDSDYVVKIPLEYDNTDCDPRDEDEIEDYRFECADEPDGWDYCEVESRYFCRAEEEGMEFAFLKTELIGHVHGHPIYKQPKAEMVAERESSHKKSWEEVDRVADYCASKHTRCFHAYWIADFIDFYGEEMFDALTDFLDSLAVHDLHEGNLGYLHGVPVIVDYSDYNEGF